MKISSSLNEKQINPKGQSFKGGVPERPVYLPEFIGKAGKWAGEYISIPEQKLLLASAAFIFQPLVDLKSARDDKKVDAAVKSASKAAAGGITGVAIRVIFDWFFKKNIGFDDIGRKKQNFVNDYFFPSKAIDAYKRNPSLTNKRLQRYSSTLAVMLALLVMSLVTNEKIDVPLTGDFQDFFNGIAKENKTLKRSFLDTISARFKKIKNWVNNKIRFCIFTYEKTHRIAGIIKEKETDIKRRDNKK